MTARRVRVDIRRAGRRVGFVLLALSLFDIAFYAFLTRPKVRDFENLVVGSQPQRDALERRRTQVEAREAFLGSLQQTERDLKWLREDVLSTRKQRLVDVQRELEVLCNQFGIDLQSVNSSNDLLGEEELDKFVMVVPLEGNYENLRNFLNAVETSDKFLLVEKVALAEGEGGAALQLSITLATYFDLPEEWKRARPERAPGRRG